MDLSKFNEAKLERLLDELYEQGQQDSAQFKAINTELDRRANQYTINETNIQLSAQQAKLDEHRVKINELMVVIEERYGIKYENWITWAESLYVICPVNHTVTSFAKNCKRQWECDSYLTALQKVEQLIYWNYYNHFLREFNKNHIK